MVTMGVSTGVARSILALAKFPQRRTFPLLIRYATAATTSSSLLAYSLTTCTRSSNVDFLVVLMGLPLSPLSWRESKSPKAPLLIHLLP